MEARKKEMIRLAVVLVAFGILYNISIELTAGLMWGYFIGVLCRGKGV